VSAALSALNDYAFLNGNMVVRFVFMDEGGISKHEPFVVVAGVFVHGDEKLIPLEMEIERLIRKHIAPSVQDGFCFHSTDIWSGTGKVFKNRERYPLYKRIQILRDLARIPKKLDISIVHEKLERAVFSKDTLEKNSSATTHEINVGAHAIAFTACTLRIEQLMRIKWKHEVAQMFAEDNDQVRQIVKGVHSILRNPSQEEGKLIPNNILPLIKIRGSVHFATKSESAPLQLADLCAFIIRGHLNRHKDNGPLYEKIKPMLLLLPPDEVYVGPLITASPPYRPVWRARPL
jgi:Protein of unknown function (DUF3800)